MKTPPITVLVADDHTLFRKALVSLLGRREDIEVVGEAENGFEAVEGSRVLQPDVVLMDIRMPGRTGISSGRLVLEASPKSRIIMLTVSERDGNLYSAFKSGARGYLLKSIDPDQIVSAIHLVMSGEAVIPHSMAERLLAEFDGASRAVLSGTDPSLNLLTEREKKVLRCLAQGKSNKEIGRLMGRSEQTVKIHLKNILRKLHFNNRIQAALYAYQRGLGSNSDTR
jgi:two-component system nitrate/nitrite response regulator NarL